MGKQIAIDRVYLEEGAWMCPKAPVNEDIPLQVKHGCGAHHWIERWFGTKVGYAFVCRYCFNVRKFPTSFYGSKVRIKLGEEGGDNANYKD